MSTLREIIQTVVEDYTDCGAKAAAAATEILDKIIEGNGYIVSVGHIYKIIETDGRDSTDEYREYAAYTEPEPEP